MMLRNAVDEMIGLQLRARGIRDPRVLDAMAKVPREAFVPERLKEQAYGDYALPIGDGQTISQPYMVALMTELLALTGRESVLEIGTGSGYQTAVLAELAERVYTVERIKPLADRAKEILAGLGYRSVLFRVDDGSRGWPEEAPFDRIIVTAATSDIPVPLFKQLAEGGRMLVPVGAPYMQVLTEVRKSNGRMETREHEGCVFVPLIGAYGMEE